MDVAIFEKIWYFQTEEAEPFSNNKSILNDPPSSHPKGLYIFERVFHFKSIFKQVRVLCHKISPNDVFRIQKLM